MVGPAGGIECNILWHQRMELSKQIPRHILKRLRESRNLQMEHVLEELVELNRLDELRRAQAKPCKKRCRRPTDPKKCVEHLQDTFNLQYRIGNCNEDANASFLLMGEPDCVLQKPGTARTRLSPKCLSMRAKKYLVDLFIDVVNTCHLESSRCHSRFAVQTGEGSETKNRWFIGMKMVHRYDTCGYTAIGLPKVKKLDPRWTSGNNAQENLCQQKLAGGTPKTEQMRRCEWQIFLWNKKSHMKPTFLHQHCMKNDICWTTLRGR